MMTHRHGHSRRVVEEFYEAWLLSLKGQNDKVQTKDGGSSAPSLTYNDETEAMVGPSGSPNEERNPKTREQLITG
jgi:hypothetical protein